MKLLDGEGNVADGSAATNHRAGQLQHSVVAQKHAAANTACCNFHEREAKVLESTTRAAAAVALKQQYLPLGVQGKHNGQV